MMRLEEISLEDLVSILNSKPIGILMLLPNVTQGKLDDKIRKVWAEIQEALSSHKLNIPIYFTFEDEKKLEVYENLKKDMESQLGPKQSLMESIPFLSSSQKFPTSTTFELKTSNSNFVPSLELSVLYGILASDEEFRKSGLPIILISASYDFLSIAPGMGRGMNAASGMMGIFELSRIFSHIIEDEKLKDSAKFEMMFVLTPGSFMEYEPSGQFLESMNPKLKERIKFIL